MNKNPIGIFDSGVGGLTVWKEVKKLLPNEDIIYLADSKNCPYGTKSHNKIIRLSTANVDFLLKQNCKLIIVACNTATAAAIETLRENHLVPFIGMEPAIKPAAINTNSGKIGVLATKGTFKGKLYKETSDKYANNISKIIQIGEGLVELVESGNVNSEKAQLLLQKYLKPMIDAGVDQIVLGCTHYPFFIPLIEKIIPKSIKIIDPAPAIAKRAKDILTKMNIENSENSAKYTFYNSNSDSRIMKQLLKSITGTDYPIVTI